MRYLSSSILIIVSVYWFFATSALAMDPGSDFREWLKNLQIEAISAGVSQETLEAALADLREPLPRVIELDRKQPEFTQTIEDYVAARVSEKRIADGRRMLSRYPTWLGRVEKKYGVQRRFIVALWGIETNFGKHTGSFPVIHSLATLAHDGRRSTYFRKELIDALHILDAGHIRLKRMKGSWAGAMGQCQFMPSSFRSYATDADGDGRIDIWSSIPDVLASAANYLKEFGWEYDQTWGHQVVVPENFDRTLVGLNTRLPLSRWQALGVRRSDGKALPRSDFDASLISANDFGGPFYLVYNNFKVLLDWNRSKAFAVAVGALSDRIITKSEMSLESAPGN